MTTDSATSGIGAFAPLRVIAAFDIGSNSIKMTVARQTPDGAVHEFLSQAETTRLGENIEATNRLADERIEASIVALETLIALARSFGATRFIGVATEATRIAVNGPAFLDRLRHELGIEIEAITGDREAEMAFLGIPAALRDKGQVLIGDIGGASTELIEALDGSMRQAISYPIGSGRFTDLLVPSDPPIAAELAAVREATGHAVQAGKWSGSSDKLIITGGTGEFLQRLLNREWPATRADFDAQLARLTTIPSSELAPMIGAAQARARILPAGVAIAAGLADLCQPKEIHGAASGIRSGLLRAAFLEE